MADRADVIQKFRPILDPEWEHVPIPTLRQEVLISYDLTNIPDQYDKQKLKETSLELIKNGLLYLNGLMGEQYGNLSSKWEVTLLPGEVFSHAGREMHLGISRKRACRQD